MLNQAYAVVVDHVEITWLRQQVKTFLPAAMENSEGPQRERLEDVLLPHIVKSGERSDDHGALDMAGPAQVVRSPEGTEGLARISRNEHASVAPKNYVGRWNTEAITSSVTGRYDC